MAGRNVVVRLSAEVSGYIAGMTKAGAATEAAMGKAEAAAHKHNKILGTLGKTAKYAGIAVAGGFALAVKEAADFNEKMALVQTLSHANAKEMVGLRASALHAGTAFGYTATQVADGQAEMVKAGVSLKNIMGGGLRGALALAAAGQTDVGTATEIAAAAMTQFGLKGKDIPHVADLLAAGADKALGSVTDLGYGLSQVGTTAHQAGLSVEQTTGTLAAFAQAGLIGERGGTTFKQMLLKLENPSGKAAKIMDQYGLSLYKANGQIKSMPALAANLQHSFEHLTPAQRNAALGTIFGTRAIQGANIMLREGSKGMADWIHKVNDQGFAARQASGKLNSLKGDMQKLKAEGVNALISLGQGSQSPLRHFVQDITTGLHHLTVDGDLRRWGNEAASALSTVGHAAKDVASVIGTVAGAFNSLPSPVKTGIVAGGIGAAVLSKVPGGKAVASKALGSVGLGRGGVVPVFVTNMKDGTGKGTGNGLPSSTVKAAAGGAASTPYGALAAIILGGSYLGAKANNYGKNPITQPHNALGGGTFGDAARNGINLPNLSLPKTGLQSFGSYQKAAHGLGGELVRIGGILGTFATGHPWKGFDDGAKKAKDAGVSIGAFGRQMKQAGASGDALKKLASGQSLTQFAYNAHKAGVSTQQLGRMFASLPDFVQTKIATPGALTSKAQVKSLAKQFDLTPRQIKTIMALLGFQDTKDKTDKTRHHLKQLNDTTAKPKVVPQGTDQTDTKVNKNKKNLHTLGVTTAKPKVLLNDSGVASSARRDQAAIDAIHGKNVAINITTYHNSGGKRGGGPTPGKPVPNATGQATGGHIRGPGTSTSDSIPAWLSDNEYVIKAAAVRKYGVAMFHNLNSMAYAGGGLVKGYAGGGHVGSVDIDGTITHFAHSIKGVSTELHKLTTQLANARQGRKDFISTVQQANQVDLFSGTLGGFDSQAAYQTKRIRQERADLATLSKNGLSGSLYKALAGSGNAALISQFAGLTPSQLAARSSAFGALNRANTGLATQAADAAYARQIADLTRETRHLRTELHALRKHGHIGHTTHIHKATVQDSPTKKHAKKAAQKVRHG